MTRQIPTPETLISEPLAEVEERPEAAFYFNRIANETDFLKITTDFYGRCHELLPSGQGVIFQTENSAGVDTLIFDATGHKQHVFRWELRKSNNDPLHWPQQNRFWQLNVTPDGNTGRLLTLNGQLRLVKNESLNMAQQAMLSSETTDLIHEPEVLRNIELKRGHKREAYQQLTDFVIKYSLSSEGVKDRSISQAKKAEMARLKTNAQSVGFVALGTYNIPGQN